MKKYSLIKLKIYDKLHNLTTDRVLTFGRANNDNTICIVSSPPNFAAVVDTDNINVIMLP